MIIHYARKHKQEFKGWIAWACPRCRAVRAFSCAANVLSEELMFVELSSRKVGEIKAAPGVRS